MRLRAIAALLALAGAAVWYLALAVALDVSAWIAILLAALSAVLTYVAIVHDSRRR